MRNPAGRAKQHIRQRTRDRIHHANAATHWSQLRKEHEKIADKIDPRLNWRSFWAWVFRGYIMTAFLPRRFETQQIGRAPFDPPEGATFAFKGAEKSGDKDSEQGASNAAQPFIDSVEALEAGNNAQIA